MREKLDKIQVRGNPRSVLVLSVVFKKMKKSDAIS